VCRLYSRFRPDGQRPIGVLEFYRRSAGGLAAEEYASAKACAAAIAHQLTSNWQDYIVCFGSVERAIDAAATTGADVKEPIDPFTRNQIHVAAGMVSLQLGISTEDGADRLRAFSFACGRPVSSVAGTLFPAG
jgi:hypothetical protein